MVKGFDSRYTTTIPLSTEYEFAGIKVSQGVGWGPASQPLIQWKLAGDLAIYRMPFHFWRYGGDASDGIAQAEWFWEVYMKEFLPDGEAELPPVLDLEDSYSPKGLTVIRNIMAFLDKTEELWGREPLIYSAGWWFDSWVKPYTLPSHRIYDFELWEADPPPDTPIGYWSESKIVQVRLDFSKPGFSAKIDENWVEDEEWYDSVSGGGAPGIPPMDRKIELIVPADAEVVITKRT